MLCGGSGASAANPVRFLLPPAAESAAPHRYPDLYGAHAAAEAAAAEAAAEAAAAEAAAARQAEESTCVTCAVESPDEGAEAAAVDPAPSDEPPGL